MKNPNRLFYFFFLPLFVFHASLLMAETKSKDTESLWHSMLCFSNGLVTDMSRSGLSGLMTDFKEKVYNNKIKENLMINNGLEQNDKIVNEEVNDKDIEHESNEPINRCGNETDIKNECLKWLKMYEEAWETEDIELLEILGHRMNKRAKKKVEDLFNMTEKRNVVIANQNIKHIDMVKCTANIIYERHDEFFDFEEGYQETPLMDYSKTLKKEGKKWILVKDYF